jgi:hypothetical protein
MPPFAEGTEASAESLRPQRKASSASRLHIQVPDPPRRPAGAIRPSRMAFLSALVVLKPQ